MARAIEMQATSAPRIITSSGLLAPGSSCWPGHLCDVELHDELTLARTSPVRSVPCSQILQQTKEFGDTQGSALACLWRFRKSVLHYHAREPSTTLRKTSRNIQNQHKLRDPLGLAPEAFQALFTQTMSMSPKPYVRRTRPLHCSHF